MDKSCFCQEVRLADNVWRIMEMFGGEHNGDCYLVTGEKRALLIDCLTHECGLTDKIASITDLPYDVFITHGHGDHAGAETANLYNAGHTVYMTAADVKLLLNMWRMGAPKKSMFTDVDFTSIDLGGVALELLPMPGHTPGGVMLLYRERAMLFSGDAIGCGAFWMQLRGCLPLSVFYAEYKKLLPSLLAIDGIKILTGHSHAPEDMYDASYLRELDAATAGILDGSTPGEVDNEGRFKGTMLLNRGQLDQYRYDKNNL